MENHEKPFIGLATTPFAHYFENYIGIIRSNLYNKGETFDKEENKLMLEKFITAIENILKQVSNGTLRIDDAVSIDEIQGAIDVAKSITDPSDRTQIKKLYDVYEPIKKKRNIQ